MPVVIVGDYDADGVTATAILVKLLHHFGVSPRAIIPRRFTNGYGITHSLVEGISHSLLITVDNGIAAVEPIQAAKAAGNVVLILDHHLPQAEIPPADVIVDPHLHPERNGYEHYCGAGLAYKLAEYLCREASSQEKKDLFFDLLVLACLGTLADVMPLTGDNRRLVMSGLAVINRDSSPLASSLCWTCPPAPIRRTPSSSKRPPFSTPQAGCLTREAHRYSKHSSPQSLLPQLVTPPR